MQLITSAAAVPAVAFAGQMPALASEVRIDRTRWAGAKARYFTAKRDLQKASGSHKDAALDRLDAALDAFLAVPSPSPKALGEKLRILELEYGVDAQPRHIVAIYEDARAFA